MRRNLVSVIVLAVTAMGLIYGNRIISANLDSERKSRLQAVQDNTVREFRHVIEQFGQFVSSTRSFMRQSGSFPSEDELFIFMKEAARNTDLEGKYILSVMDTTHQFFYSFDHEEINPSDLVGKSLLDFTDSSALLKYNEVMRDDHLHLFKPHNLVEGKVGISINFRLLKERTPIGYVIPIIDFKSALDEVYDQSFVEDFVFHFSTGEGIDFDRERVYDGTRVYHNRIDSLYYQNFSVKQEDFIYNDFEIYGFDFRIGTAYNQPAPFNWLPLVSVVWFLVLVLLTLYINHQSGLLEKTNHDLRIANASKIKFFSILGHDVKGPLKQIQTIMAIRKTGKMTDEAVDSTLQQLTDATENTVNLVDHLLEWAQLNAEKVEPDFQRIDLMEILSQVVQLHKTAAALKEIQLSAELKAPLVMQGDANMLETIFRNLIGNALKFTDRDGKILVSGKQLKNQVMVEITDDGVGMDPEQVASIFRLDKEDTSKGTEGEYGTGLGMLLVKEYTDIHRGKIQIRSKKNVGSTFLVSFPVSGNR